MLASGSTGGSRDFPTDYGVPPPIDTTTHGHVLVASARPVVDITAGDVDFKSLTPDALMFYCEMHLNDLNATANGYFEHQKQVIGEKKLLNQASEVLKEATPGGSDLNDQAKVNKMTADLTSIKNELAKVDQAAADSVQKVIDKLNEGHDGAVSKTDFESCQSMLEGAKGNLDADSEMNMLKLQTVMSQKGQAIQMCTNLIQSCGQQQMSIAQNVGK